MKIKTTIFLYTVFCLYLSTGLAFNVWQVDDSIFCAFNHSNENGVRFNLSVSNLFQKGYAYVGLGLSDDESMGNDDVVSCLLRNGEVAVEVSYNSEKYQNVLDDKQEQSPTVFNVTTEYNADDGMMSCAFSRPLEFTTNIGGKQYNFANHLYYLLIAAGNLNEEGLKERHSEKFVSSMAVNLTSNSSASWVLASADLNSNHLFGSKLITVHGLFQIVAWCVLAPISYFTVAFYRPYFQNKFVVRKQKWFVVHVVMNWALFFICILSIFIAFFHKNFQFEVNVHTSLGVVVMFSLMMQLLMGLLRPELDSKWRVVFSWGHRLFGMSLVLLSLITCHFGLKEYNLKHQNNNVAYTHYMVFLVLLTLIIFSMAALYINRQVKARYLAAEVGGSSTQTADPDARSTAKFTEPMQSANDMDDDQHENDESRQLSSQKEEDVQQCEEFRLRSANSEESLDSDVDTKSVFVISPNTPVSLKSDAMIKLHYSFIVVVLVIAVLIYIDLFANLSGKLFG
ncbi:ferric-chelate reductase 1-like [Convolutriloba macropyga]|uniref:ferric-chelate reductase 1-like n=1 Tax=Convolutriloba macropyga TaxID=536237 RepID=UPI003F51D497